MPYSTPRTGISAGIPATFPLSGATTACTPLQRRRGRKRTLLPAIMHAAMDLFARWGFEQPTMDQVAKAAGVRKATLYLYFGSKSALVDAVVNQWLSELPYRPVVSSLPLRQQLVDIGLQLRSFAAHTGTIALTKWIGEAELRLHPRQLTTWRERYTEFSSHVAEILGRHCHCQDGSRAANQFLILAVGDLGLESSALRVEEMERVESAVELTLRAYPQRVDQLVDDGAEVPNLPR